jgi:glc operon protein GlcG
MAYFGDRRYIGFNGGLPVKFNGVVVGGIGVSGLSGAEDERLAALGVEAMLNHN